MSKGLIKLIGMLIMICLYMYKAHLLNQKANIDREIERMNNSLYIPELSYSSAKSIDKTRIKSMMKKHIKEKYDFELIMGDIEVGKIFTLGEYGGYFYAPIYIKDDANNELNKGSVEVYRKDEKFTVSDDYNEVMSKKYSKKLLFSEVKKQFGEKVILRAYTKLLEGDEAEKYGDYVIPTKKLLEENKGKDTKVYQKYILYIFDRKKSKKYYQNRLIKLISKIKELGYFEYLEIRVRVIDYRKLAGSAYKYEEFLEKSALEQKKVNGEVLYIPIRKNRKRVANELAKEYKKMSKKKLLESLKSKDNRYYDEKDSYKEFGKYFGRYYSIITSKKLLKHKYEDDYNKDKETGILERHNYSRLEDIIMEDYNEYIFD